MEVMSGAGNIGPWLEGSYKAIMMQVTLSHVSNWSARHLRYMDDVDGHGEASVKMQEGRLPSRAAPWPLIPASALPPPQPCHLQLLSGYWHTSRAKLFNNRNAIC